MQILTNNHIHMEGIKNCEVGLSIIYFRMLIWMVNETKYEVNLD